MKIIASFDDGTKDDLRVAELMEKYDIECIFYWPVYPEHCNELVGRESLSENDMSQISDLFEIGSHTVTHPLLTRIPLDEARYEIFASKKLLQEKFGKLVSKFCYPRGYSNPDLQMFVKQAGYRLARGVGVGYIHEPENKYYVVPSVHVGYDRREYGGKPWLGYATSLLEEAVKTPDSVYEMMGHSWELTKYDGWYDFEKLLERASGARS